MKKILELNIKGIKCDNPECNYTNNDVNFEDYKEWLNKPCPKCGSILLTKEDYITTVKLINMVTAINRITPVKNNKNNDEKIKVNVEMNGTGKINFSKKE